MKLNWNFLGGWGYKTKNLRRGGGGGVWIFSGTAYYLFVIFMFCRPPFLKVSFYVLNEREILQHSVFFPKDQDDMS